MKEKRKLELTLGVDPELFLAYQVQPEEDETGPEPDIFTIRQLCEPSLVSALSAIGVEKDNPILLAGGYSLYADNVLAEFTTPVAGSAMELVGIVGGGLRAVGAWLEPRGLSPVALSLAEMPYCELRDERANQVGCNPSYDGYTFQENARASFDGNASRTGSCHIHVGNRRHGDDNAILTDRRSRAIAIRILDIVVGLAEVAMTKKPARALARRTMYGKAGEYRPTRYGLEWRVPGNEILALPEMFSIIAKLVESAMKMVEDETAMDIINKVSEDDVRRAINESDRSHAIDIAEGVHAWPCNENQIIRTIYYNNSHTMLGFNGTIDMAKWA